MRTQNRPRRERPRPKKRSKWRYNPAPRRQRRYSVTREPRFEKYGVLIVWCTEFCYHDWRW